nr:hypothetical protein [Marinilabiliaceae bacterium A049]
MATRPKNSEADTLELYRVALENAETQSEIATVMAELGYDSAKITEGKTLLTETRSAYDFNKTEDDGYFGSFCASIIGLICASDFGSNCATFGHELM